MPTAAMEVDKENQEMVAGASGVESKAPVRSKGVSADDDREAFSPDLLRIYYARLFPYEQVCGHVSLGDRLGDYPDPSCCWYQSLYAAFLDCKTAQRNERKTGFESP